MQAADQLIARQRDELALCVGTESMSRNPIAAYTHRGGFRMGPVEFKDFLWEALLDPRRQVDAWATPRRIWPRAIPDHARRGGCLCGAQLRARDDGAGSGFLAGEIAPVKNETFEREGYQTRGIKLRRRQGAGRRHPCARLPARGAGRPSGRRSAACRPAATARPSSTARRRRWSPPATTSSSRQAAAGAHRRRRDRRRAAGDHGHRAGAGDPRRARARGPEALRHRPLRDQRGVRRAGAWPARASSASTRTSSTSTAARSPSATRWAQPACGSRSRWRASCSARQLRYGIASACIGGGQGIALLIENPDAAHSTEELTMDIKGHAAIVTGGASGLGAATAASCAAPAPRSPASTSISTAPARWRRRSAAWRCVAT